jgi:cytochrome c-type biogenesis protein CcmE
MTDNVTSLKVKPRTKRAIWIVVGVALLAAALALVLNAFNKNLVFFFTPSQIASGEAPQGKAFRMGGLVENGTLERKPDSTTVFFKVTDKAKIVPVEYTGILPDLFKEGRGVVAQGRLGGDGIFRATEILAKHDENYMPPEAAEALKKAGHPVGAPSQFQVAPSSNSATPASGKKP